MIRRFILTEARNDELAGHIEKFMRLHNLDVNAEFMAALSDPVSDALLMHLFVTDENEQMMGGLLGETQFAWCKIHIIAVARRHRRMGLGSELLRRAEDEALSRGCKHVYLDSMEYHAPDFYRKQGYELVGKLEDWDSLGHTKFLFTKAIGA